ncbi:Uncharacterised protein [Serratia marcescens]|uniref:hypothetical protein n=1 Tax=Serratia marcescens TaxID=615 RepID=UPI0018D78F94|nr:hypothetical protein [Serratia marcescens]MBH2526204.1 hypothetical protein [Serratia marcescens]MBH2888074.1 hypothetical protein [Serratia marcescens]MBH3137818.1 hypothetical protein [Serratia marcescens]CAI1843168.1 Uncharacterised protein [Serratia marcescens]HEJ7271160.1 hypothetical protein [Serratia marcescens]
MRKKIVLLGCALLMCSQLSQAGLVIEGGLNGNTGSGGGTSVDVSINGSTNGGNGTGVNIGGQNGAAQKPGSSASQLQKDIYASICASPFMKKYASICQ